MRHTAAVAELNGWAHALGNAIENGTISPEVGFNLSALAGDHVREFLNGKSVNGKHLSDYTSDDKLFDDVVDNYNAIQQGYPDAE